MRTRIDCCYQCPDRYPGCHGVCEKYKQQKAELEEAKAETMKRFAVNQSISNQRADGVFRATKYRNYRNKYR